MKKILFFLLLSITLYSCSSNAEEDPIVEVGNPVAPLKFEQDHFEFDLNGGVQYVSELSAHNLCIVYDIKEYDEQGHLVKLIEQTDKNNSVLSVLSCDELTVSYDMKTSTACVNVTAAESPVYKKWSITLQSIPASAELEVIQKQ